MRGLPVLVLLFLLSAAVAGEEPTPVEQGKARAPEGGVLGTTRYTPSEAEKPFFDRLAPKERMTGSAFSDYEITGREGEYVSWFGIVREIRELPGRGETRLLVEMKYFDTLTDLHQQLVSMFGAGDFRAVLRGTDRGIRHLGLVRVYGKVADEEDGVPELHAEFVRHWDQGHYAFMALGKPKGDTKWLDRHMKVPFDKAYSARPGATYYEKRLGSRGFPPLHERLGGEKIEAVARDLHERLMKNPTIAEHPRLPGVLGRAGIRTFVKGAVRLFRAAAGDAEASPPRLTGIHESHGLTAGEWDAGLEELGRALDAAGVGRDDRDQLVDLVTVEVEKARTPRRK